MSSGIEKQNINGWDPDLEIGIFPAYFGGLIFLLTNSALFIGKLRSPNFL
jgi:hypothetical protein